MKLIRSLGCLVILVYSIWAVSGQEIDPKEDIILLDVSDEVIDNKTKLNFNVYVSESSENEVIGKFCVKLPNGDICECDGIFYNGFIWGVIQFNDDLTGQTAGIKSIAHISSFLLLDGSDGEALCECGNDLTCDIGEELTDHAPNEGWYDYTFGSGPHRFEESTDSYFPEDVSISPLNGYWQYPSIWWTDEVHFEYFGSEPGVKIRIINESGEVVVEGSMSGSAGNWYYDYTFYPEHGRMTVEFLDCNNNQLESVIIYVDPSGVVFDSCTGEPVGGATVTLYYKTAGEYWELAEPGIFDPEDGKVTNPQTTDSGGGYGWDVVNGTYKVVVNKDDYIDAESIEVTVPPPVTNLNIGLMPVGGCQAQPYVVSSDSSGDGKKCFYP